MRRHVRSTVNLRAVVHAGMTFRTTTIRDLSDGGVGLSGADGLFPGSRVTIELVTGEKRAGTVRWWLAGCCGVQFHEPLTPGDPFREAALRRAGPRVV